MSRYAVRPDLGWFKRLTGVERQRVSIAAHRALTSEPTFTALAKRTGLSAQYLSRLRSGDNEISKPSMVALAGVLGTSLEAVLAGTWQGPA